MACPLEAREKKPADAGFFVSERLKFELLRTRIYVDGYNLYYGCLKGTSLKWLDIFKLFEKIVLPSSIAPVNGQPASFTFCPLAIKYFTAPILEQAASADDSLKCQEIYHAALTKHQPARLEIIKGYYSLTQARAKLIDTSNPKRWPKYCQPVAIWKLEEKQSDVNLALHAFKDATLGEVDQVVIVTNDTDIAPALEMIRQVTDAVVGVVIPTTDQQRRPNKALVDHAHWVRSHITNDELRSAQLPRVVTFGKKTYSKPDSWYARPELLQRALQLGTTKLGARNKVFQWLQKPNPHWDGRCPIDMLETAEAELVVQFMEKLE